MSHFLSSVTQRRLELRRMDDTRTNDPSLFCLPQDVCGNFRCAASSHAPWLASGGNHADTSERERDVSGSGAVGTSLTCHTTVWCGEQDGSLSVRNPLTGDVLACIPPKCKAAVVTSKRGSTNAAAATNVFVFCLISPRADHMWAGMSDGTIAVYDCSTMQCQHVFLAHSTAVVSMVVANMPTRDEEFEHHMNIVISASLDWTMVKWDTTTWQCLGRFTGHRAAVRCIAASNSGEFLVSGGDDGSLRMWSLEHVTEIQSLQGSETSKSAWPILAAHEGPVSAVTFVNDSWIVSTGLNGCAVVWSLTGACVHVLERRACGLSSVFHDSVCGRLMIGGLDGVMEVFSDVDDNDAADSPSGSCTPWEPLGRLTDHSGAYLSSFVPVRYDNLQRMWLVDFDGRLTHVEETIEIPLIEERRVSDAVSTPSPRRNRSYATSSSVMNVAGWRVEGRLEQDDANAMVEADQLRQHMIQSYSELRQHRTTLVNAERRDRKRRELAVLALGCRLRDEHQAILKVKRWLVRHKIESLARVRVAWFEKTSKIQFLSACFWRWLIVARDRNKIIEKQYFSEAVRSVTVGLSRTQIATQLHLALRDKKHARRLRPLVAAVERMGNNSTRRRYFFTWMGALLHLRFRGCRSHLSGCRQRVARLTDAATETRRQSLDAWRSAFIEQESVLAGAYATATVDYALRARSFERWRRFASRAVCIRRDAALQISSQVTSLALVRDAFTRWFALRCTRCEQREKKRQDFLREELALWESMLSNVSHLSQESIAQEIADEEEKARQRALLLSELNKEAQETLDGIHEIKGDLAATGFRIPPGLDLESRVDAVFTYLKARGINAFQDAAVILSSKESYATMPLYVAIPASSPQRTATPARRGSAPAAGGLKRAGSPSKTSVKAPPKPKSLLNEFDAVCERLRVTLRAAASAARESELGSITDVTSLDSVEGVNALDLEDWGVTPTIAALFKRKDIKECAQVIRRLICLYDCIRVKQSDAAATAMIYKALPESTASTQAQNRMISTATLRSILCNAPAIIHIATYDFCKSALEYVEISEEAAKRAAETPTRQSPAPVRKGSAVTATVIKPMGTPPVRRHSSPAASTPRGATAAPQTAITPPSTVVRRAPSPAVGTRTPAAVPVATKSSPSRGSSVASHATRGESPSSVATSSSPAPRAPPQQAKRPFLGLRVAVGPPLFPEKSRAPSLAVAECSEWYPASPESAEETLSGPCYAAGIREGDLLYRFAGYVVTDLASFNAIVARHAKPGATIPVQVVHPTTRDIRSLTVTVGSR